MQTKLEPRTIKAFEQYVENVEELMAKRHDGALSFLWLDENPKIRNQVLRGRIPVEQLDDVSEIGGGLVHNWIAGMFIPDAKIGDVVAVFQDYNGYSDVYPEVIKSRLVSQDGDTFQIYQRLLKKKVLTVVLDSYHEARYRKLSEKRSVLQSKSTKIQQVENAGTPQEIILPVGEDGGFMWRLNVYWRLEQDDDGVFAECHSVSLSRSIPRGLR